jgi:transcriptional regulator with XRE-family HTH domain
MSKNNMPGVDSLNERVIFGLNFRVARARSGLSQRDVHRLTGVAQSHISEIETGASNISIDTMVKLATVVKQPLWKLFKPTGTKSEGVNASTLAKPGNPARRN